MGDTTDDLLGQAVRGDREALAALLSRNGPAARLAITDRIPERWRSLLSEDDILQQTYADAFVKISGFTSESESSFSRWLATIAERNLQDAIRMLEAEKRGGKTRHRISTGREDDSHFDLFTQVLAASGASPSAHVGRSEAVEAMKRALREVPEAYARVITLYDLEARPIEEVCQVLNRSQGAVFMLRIRAHHRLHEIMGRTSKFFSSSS